ncbi:hypothetical protein IAQ61_003842 [Plenodomus lingam]|uniref:uncharacterized protein n=1 Tax=Leptosphaeria maculans TaxID=5022 RepID=UPI0033213446|nr:hypothetical protein IAQ61_003842 [Plenodomus lingam]
MQRAQQLSQNPATSGARSWLSALALSGLPILGISKVIREPMRARPVVCYWPSEQTSTLPNGHSPVQAIK